MCRRRESWAAARYSSEVQRGDRPALKLHTPPAALPNARSACATTGVPARKIHGRQSEALIVVNLSSRDRHNGVARQERHSAVDNAWA